MSDFRNHCRNSVRCEECPIRLVGQPEDRVEAGFIVSMAIANARDESLTPGDLSKQGTDEIMDRVTEAAQLVRRPDLAGVAVGAFVVTVAGHCTTADKLN